MFNVREVHAYIHILALYLEEFLRAELEDIVKLLLGHGGAFVSKTGSHHEMSQHHLPFGDLGDSLLHGVPSHKAINHDFVVLTDTVSPAEGLRKAKLRHCTEISLSTHTQKKTSQRIKPHYSLFTHMFDRDVSIFFYTERFLLTLKHHNPLLQ